MAGSTWSRGRRIIRVQRSALDLSQRQHPRVDILFINIHQGYVPRFHQGRCWSRRATSVVVGRVVGNEKATVDLAREWYFCMCDLPYSPASRREIRRRSSCSTLAGRAHNRSDLPAYINHANLRYVIAKSVLRLGTPRCPPCQTS